MGRKAGWLACGVFCLSGLVYGQEGGQPGGGAFTLPEGEGKELLAEACGTCHGVNSIRNLRNGEKGWRDVVEWMVLNGAVLTSEEADTIVRYLATHFGPGRNPIRTGPLPPETALGAGVKEISLPEGPGKEVVQARCTICHDLGWIVHTKRSREDWERVVKNMIERGPDAPPQQIQTLLTYLTTHFGKEPK